MHADHTGIVRIMSIKNALAHKRIAHRRIHFRRKLPHFFICAGNHGAAAHINIRSLCLLDCFHRPFDILFRKTFLLWQFFGSRFRIFTFIGRYVFRNIYKNRTRSAASCYGKCLADGIRKNRNIFYDIAVLGDRHGNAGNIHFLKRIFAKQRQIHITGNCYHRHGIHISSGNAGHQIRGAGAACGQTDTDFTGCSGISVRCMGCSLLMRSQNMCYFITMLI